jgi:hypothetical protein
MGLMANPVFLAMKMAEVGLVGVVGSMLWAVGLVGVKMGVVPSNPSAASHQLKWLQWCVMTL